LKTPTEKVIEELPPEPRKEVLSDRHTQLQIRAERRLLREGYEIYSYQELPSEVKEKLGGDPDICARKRDNGEWLFIEVCVTGQPKVDKYSEAGKVALVLPVESGKSVEVWGEKELENF